MTVKQEEEGARVLKSDISLYEFYALGIERLIEKAPWELERAVSAYHERFLTEQRCLALAILLLLGEEHVPRQTVESMPGFEDQARSSVNQATFLRALKHYFERRRLSPDRAEMVLEMMQSYLTDSRQARAGNKDPLEAMLGTVVKRVPPQNDGQKEGYARRLEKIYDYVAGLVEKGLLGRYDIVS